MSQPLGEGVALGAAPNVVSEEVDDPSRRRFLAGVVGFGTLVVTEGLLSACGADGEPAAPNSTSGGATSGNTAATATNEALPPVSPPNAARLRSYNETVRGVGQMERVAGRDMFAGTMEFYRVPADDNELREDLTWEPAGLQQTEEAGFNRPPLTILEPADPRLRDTDFLRTRLDRYASAMREAGVTDRMWGPIVVSPEPVVGELEGSNADAFVEAVNAQRAVLAEHFPGTQSTILIDTAPQERRPILDALRRRPLDRPLESVVVQAYSNGQAIRFDRNGRPDISHFLTADLVAEIAETTGTRRVLISTGIPREDANSYARGAYTPEQRLAVANAMADVVEEVQRRGLQVDGLVLFGQDKMHVPEEKPERRDFSFRRGDEEILTTLHDRLRAPRVNVPLIGYNVVPEK